MKLLVLDGNSIVNRAFYGIKLLTTKNGQYTNAIHGFLNILLKLEKEETPDEIAIAFDLKAPTFRHKMFAEYKGHRKGMPEELAAQMPVLKELLAEMGYKDVSLAGYEADDILGTLSAVSEKRGDQCLLATGDKDSLQLVGEGTTVLLTTTRFGKGETARMDYDAVMEKYGITPSQLIDVKALMGDASDNIPGVAGVGEKTALLLIQSFGTLENVYNNLDNPIIKVGVRKKLEDGKESAEMSRQLAEICLTVPVDTAVGTYTKSPANAANVSRILSGLEMFSILDRLGLEETSPAPIETKSNIPTACANPLTGDITSECVLLSPTKTGWILVDGNRVYADSATSPHLLALLVNPKIRKKVANSKDLYRIALAAGKKAENLSFDATLAAYLLNPSGSDYSTIRLVAEYNIAPKFHCEDYPEAGSLAELYETLLAKCEESGMRKLLEEIEQPLAEVLASMELCGVKLDSDSLRAFGEELQIELKKELENIYSISGCKFNVNSPKQLGEVLFDKMQLPHRKKTKNGWSTDAETLESLREYTPLIDHILLYRGYQKLNSTYVEGLLKAVGEDGRIHSTFNQTEARTGRISSNEPNMQNIPVRTELGSQLRKFFIAEDGKLFADADYSQIELRILAHISGDEAMKEAFMQGEDIHRTTAARVNGLPIEMVTPGMRSAAKAVNFGIVYGIGAFSLSKDIGVSVKEASQFIKNYLASFPGVKNYMDNIVLEGRENGYVTTLFGRRRPLPELSSSNFNMRALGERMALNTPIQGTAADIIKLAMIRVYRRLNEENLAAKLILQVHDELIVEAPKDEIEKISLLLKEEMQNSAELSILLLADVNTGTTWFEAKG